MPAFTYRRIKQFDNTEMFTSENENAYFPFHFHDIFCVSLITKGTEILKIAEQEFIAPAGSISITQVNEVHRNYSLEENGYSYRTLYVNPSVLQYFNNNKQIGHLERVIYDAALFNKLSSLFLKKEVTNISLLESCFVQLAKHACEPSSKHTWAGNFYKIDEIIDAHPNTVIETDWLARKFCMSKFHFIRAFKKAKGVTPQTYIMLSRLANAKKLLIQQAPINDIAYLNGFCDPSHFTNAFKKYFGVSPSHYLKS